MVDIHRIFTNLPTAPPATGPCHIDVFSSCMSVLLLQPVHVDGRQLDDFLIAKALYCHLFLRNYSCHEIVSTRSSMLIRCSLDVLTRLDPAD